MSPKNKFNKDEIINLAFEYVRKNGWEGLSARYLAQQLNASTMPIYSYIGSMKNLEEEIVKKAYDLLYEHITTSTTGDIWLDQGLGYVQFAKLENPLFQCINDHKHGHLRRKYGLKIWKKLAENLSDYQAFEGLAPEQLDAIRDARWVYVHGLSTLINNSILETYDDEQLKQYIQMTQNVLLMGFKEMFKKNS